MRRMSIGDPPPSRGNIDPQQHEASQVDQSFKIIRRRSPCVSGSRATLKLTIVWKIIALRGIPERFVKSGDRSSSGKTAGPPERNNDHRHAPETGQTGRQNPCAYAPDGNICSIAPNIEWPALSFISMRTVSPKRRNGVFAAPCRDRLDHALLGDAGIAAAAFATGLPGPPSACWRRCRSR